MKYIIKESQLEDLIKKSRERHSGHTKNDLQSGSFDLNGKPVYYDLYVKNQDSVYANTRKGQNRYYIFIMNELDYLLLSDKEKKSVAEYRIKRYIEKKES